MEKVIILGSGCAGYTAAVYASRANLNPLLLTGIELHGQLGLTTEVENYPGFPEGVMGPKLMQMMKHQAEKFGTRMVHDHATAVDFSKKPFRIKAHDSEYESLSVIICTGATPKKLGIKGEEAFWGYGVSSCATCDGAFFKNQELIVVGGGDTAMEEALFLTRYASKINVIHRRDALRASKIMQERAFKNPKINFVWNSVVEEILGDENKAVTGVRLKNVNNNEQTEKPVQGVFLGIGHEPNTGIFKGQLALDEAGYIVTDRRQRTSVEGVFAAGDAQDQIYRQAVTAAGTGCAAAIEAERYISEIEDSAK
jgi:thioredoxin reductase (NADPH)